MRKRVSSPVFAAGMIAFVSCVLDWGFVVPEKPGSADSIAWVQLPISGLWIANAPDRGLLSFLIGALALLVIGGIDWNNWLSLRPGFQRLRGEEEIPTGDVMEWTVLIAFCAVLMSAARCELVSIERREVALTLANWLFGISMLAAFVGGAIRMLKANAR